MELRGLFKKNIHKNESVNADENNINVPDGLYTKCPFCSKMILTEDLYINKYVCPECGYYMRLDARTRIAMVTDVDTFTEWDTDIKESNPCSYEGYEEKIRETKEKTNIDEAVITGIGEIGKIKTVIGVCDTRFLMGSMGEVVGEKLTRAIEKATDMKLPVIIFTCSGGARMQEGIVSLMQMAKISAALKKHDESGLLYITVLTDPTTGGVTASFAMLGDIILAEPGALIGFAGPRVIKQTIGQELPEGFQRSEFLLEHGFVDAIVKREKLKDRLFYLLNLHKRSINMSDNEKVNKNESAADNKNKDINDNDKVHDCLNKDYQTDKIYISNTIKKYKKYLDNIYSKKIDIAQEKKAEADNKIYNDYDVWKKVETARSTYRPTAFDYIEKITKDFMEFHGDRCFGDDKAIIGGIATFGSIPVTVIGHMKGKNTKENIERNFGMPNPEGYRKALRLMKQAEKFNRPVICFIDTPGAYCGIGAEERGQGEAIARNLYEMSELKVPVLSIVTGEGGSGGALALGVANEVWMMENSIYSILSPEGYASILWKDARKAKEAAETMKLTAKDLYDLNIIEKIIPEYPVISSNNINRITLYMKRMMCDFLLKYCGMSKDELIEHRYERFRKM